LSVDDGVLLLHTDGKDVIGHGRPHVVLKRDTTRPEYAQRSAGNIIAWAGGEFDKDVPSTCRCVGIGLSPFPVKPVLPHCLLQPQISCLEI
jgi:hypothetical protein